MEKEEENPKCAEMNKKEALSIIYFVNKRLTA